MSKKKADRADRVPFGKLLAWQTRPISLGAVTIIIGYLSMYCTDTLGMPAALVGTILLASKVFDGVTDLFAGWLIDNTNTRWGKARPYELSILGVWICTWALFATPYEWSITAKSIWIFIMYTLIFSIFSTLLNAAETPYIIRAFGDPIAITKVSAYGGILITIGCMVVSVSFPIMVARAGTSVSGWRQMMFMYAVPLALIGLLRMFFVKEDKAPDADKEERVTVKSILAVLKKNKYVGMLGIACACPQLVTGMAAATYYFKVVVGDIGKFSSIQICSMLVLFVMLVFPALMKKFSGMQLVGMGAAVGIVGYIINFFAGSNMVLLVIGFLLAGISALPTSYMRAPINLQLAEYNESLSLPRMESTMGSAVNFVCKIGQGLGSFIIGVLLSAASYDGQLAVQPDSAVLMIRLLYSFIPVVFMIIMLLCTKGFMPLDRMSKQGK